MAGGAWWEGVLSEVLGGMEHGQRRLVGRGEFPRLTELISFILWRKRHLHDGRAEEILQRHEEARLQETSEAHPQAIGMLGSSPWSTAWGALQATSCPKVNEAAPGKSIYQGKEPNPGSPLLLFRQDLDRSWGFRRGSHQATSFESALHSWVCCKGQVGDPFFRD